MEFMQFLNPNNTCEGQQIAQIISNSIKHDNGYTTSIKQGKQLLMNC